MLEAGRVGGVASDRHIDILAPVDSHTLAYVVSTVAVDLGTRTIGVSRAIHDLQLARVVVELRLHIGEAVDTADDHGSVLAQTVEDNAERILAHLVGHLGNLDGTLGSSKRLVTSQKGEALRLLAEQTGSQVAVTQTHLAVVGHRTRDAECLQTHTDSLCAVGSSLASTLDGNSSTADIGPLGVLEADTLRLLTHQIRINTCLVADLISLLYALDALSVESCKNLRLTTLLTFVTYLSNHNYVSPYYSLRGSIALTTPCSAVVRP